MKWKYPRKKEKDVDIEVNTEKTRYMFIYLLHQNVGKIHNIRESNNFFIKWLCSDIWR